MELCKGHHVFIKLYRYSFIFRIVCKDGVRILKERNAHPTLMFLYTKWCEFHNYSVVFKYSFREKE